MRITEIRGRQVVDPITAHKRGRVVDVLTDPTTGRLAGLDIAADGAEATERIPADRIFRIGRAAVMLTRAVDPEIREVAEHPEQCLDYASLVGLEVLDEGGDMVGYLQDALVDPDRLSITAYVLVAAGWRRWLDRGSDIGPGEVTSWSRELMLIKARSAARNGLNAGSPLPETTQVPTPPLTATSAPPEHPE